MSKDVKIEILYFKCGTDVSLEFGLHGDYPMRLLTSGSTDLNSFFHSFKRAIMRSQIIIIVGGYNGNEYIPSFVSKCIGRKVSIPNYSEFGILTDVDYILPDGAIPLKSFNSRFGGFILESGPQSIISLTDDKDIRRLITKDTILKYITEYYNVFVLNKPAVSPKSTAEEPPKNEDNIVETCQPVKEQNNVPMIFDDISSSSTKKVNNQEQTSSVVQEANQPTINTPVVDTNIFIAPDVEQNEHEQLEIDFAAPTVNQNDIRNITDKYVKPEQTAISQDFDLSDDFDFGINSKPQKNSSGHRKIRIISIILIIAMILGAFGAVAFVKYKSNDKKFDLYAAMAGLYDKSGRDYKTAINRLKNYNSSIDAWLSINNSNINYPVVLINDNTDIAYLNSHLPNGSVDPRGTVYTYSNLSTNKYPRVSIIKGNANENGVFSELGDYFNKNYSGENKIITTTNKYNKTTWEIFSVFISSSDSDFDYYKTDFADDLSYSEQVHLIHSESLYKFSESVTVPQSILILVGTINNKEYVVVARETGSDLSVNVIGSTSSPSSSDIILGVNDSNVSFVGKEDSSYSTTSEQDYVTPPNIIVPPVTPIEPIVSTPSQSTSSNVTSSTATSSNISSSNISSSNISSSNISSSNISSSNISSSNISSSNISTSNISSSNTSSSNTEISSILSSLGSSSSIASSETSSESTPSTPPVTVDPIFTWDVQFTVTNGSNRITGKAVDIVAMVCEAEMGSHYPIEALKSQAIASYSWLICHNAHDGDSAPSVPMKTAGARSIEAVNAVKGTISVSDGGFVPLYVHACSAGKTANNQHIWQWNAWQNTTPISYLQSVDSSIDEGVDGYKTTTVYSANTVKSLILEKYGIDVSSMPKSEWIKPTLYDENNLYCVRVSIGGKDVKGPDLRNVLFGLWSRSSNPNGLRSSAYTVTYNADNDTFTVVCKGWGHGVGMSQYGAREYAKQGWSYEKILKHYFTGLELVKY